MVEAPAMTDSADDGIRTLGSVSDEVNCSMIR